MLNALFFPIVQTLPGKVKTTPAEPPPAAGQHLGMKIMLVFFIPLDTERWTRNKRET